MAVSFVWGFGQLLLDWISLPRYMGRCGLERTWVALTPVCRPFPYQILAGEDAALSHCHFYKNKSIYVRNQLNSACNPQCVHSPDPKG
eukprot:4084985-Amphidinium_carterae.1